MTLRIEDHAERLLAATVAGGSTSHGAENNLRKIGLMVEADPNNTYGMEGLLRGATFGEVYEAVSRQLGNAPDDEETPGRGRIDPARTAEELLRDRKSTRLNSSHANISYAVFCLKKKKKKNNST